MILHVQFTDGSNPWICFNDNRHIMAKHWRAWMKYHPDTARPVAFCGAGRCRWDHIRGQYVVTFPPNAEPKYYKHLGHALAALDRLGGENA